MPSPKTTDTYLVGLHQDENVVHPNSQHKEWDDFDHNEGQRDPDVAEDAQGAGHRAQHDEDAHDAKRDLRVYLQGNERSTGEGPFCPHFYFFTRVYLELKVQFSVQNETQKHFYMFL